MSHLPPAAADCRLVGRGVSLTDAFARLDLFQGQTTIAVARLYARIPKPSASGDFVLQGTVAGPDCKYATTLPATFSLRNQPQDRFLLAEAVIPDPCTWTIDLPATYKVKLELRQHESVVATHQQLFGFRRLGVVRSSFSQEGHRWNLRGGGGGSQQVLAESLPDWRESRMVCFCESPSDEICKEASLTGVMLAALLPTAMRGVAMQRELERLSDWPAVIAAVIDDGDLVDSSGFGSFIVGSRLERPDVSFLFLEESEVAAGLGGESDLPVVVYRKTRGIEDPHALRELCDTLQRDLAPGDFAGYCAIHD